MSEALQVILGAIALGAILTVANIITFWPLIKGEIELVRKAREK